MITHLSALDVCFVVSVTVNILGFLYFAVYICIEKVLKRWKMQSTELVDFHKNHATQLRITYLDVFVGLVLPILAVVVTFTSGILTNRYKTAEVQIQLAFSVALGVFIFMLIRNILVKSRNRSVDIVYDVVAITAFSVALCVQEEPFIGLIVMTSQGSRSTYQLQHLLKNYWKRETPCCRGYGVVVFTNTVFTVFCNGIIPLLYLLSTIMQTYSMNSQLGSYSIGCFYAYLIFFSFMNGWALCAVADESKQYLRRNKKPPSYQLTMRSSSGIMGIDTTGHSNGQAHGDINNKFPALSIEILPPPSYSQVVKEAQPTLPTCCEEKDAAVLLLEADFISIPLQTP